MRGHWAADCAAIKQGTDQMKLDKKILKCLSSANWQIYNSNLLNLPKLCLAQTLPATENSYHETNFSIIWNTYNVGFFKLFNINI